MLRVANSFQLMVCLALCACNAGAQSSHQQCAAVVSQVQLTYNHGEASSRPQLTMKIGNQASKRISTVKIGLYVLDADGVPHPYPDSLENGDGLEIGKTRTFTWDLDFDSVDIHRAGETVVVQRVEFDDGTKWSDDGSESCSFKVNYHAK